MTGLDTNILLRYLLEENDPQKASADRFFIRSAERGETLFVNQIVLCEVTWVLARALKFDRQQIGAILERLLATEQLEFEAKDLIVDALGIYRTTRADFADCLIGVRNRDSGCGATVTFDRTAGALEHFKVLAFS